jgi:hypothetical protein
LKINPDIWKEARKKAIDEGVSYSEYVEKLIEESLRKPVKIIKKQNHKEENVKSPQWLTL